MKRSSKKKLQKVFYGFRLAPDLANWLEIRADKLGQTKTRVLETTMRKGMK